MKPIISKTPDVPELSKEEVAFLTEVAFGQFISPQACDALFVFGGTHSGHWEKAIEAYQQYSMELFEYRFNQLGNQAVIIY